MNKKGFVLTEVVVVAVFIVTIFILIYTSIIPLMGVYQDKSEREENIDIVYNTYHVKKMLTKDGNKDEITKNDAIVFNCSDLADVEYCNALMEELGLKKKNENIINYSFAFTKSIKKNREYFKNIDKEIYDYFDKYKNEDEDEDTILLVNKANHTIAHLYMRDNNLLYNVLKEVAEKNNGASMYSGEHNDSFEGVGNKNIYYYNGENVNNNVIFAGYCWQMLRTTDTGGVKMIYNGIPVNNQCLNTRGGNYDIIGNGSFNADSGSLSDVGYMYNKRYPSKTISARTINFVQEIAVRRSGSPYIRGSSDNIYLSNADFTTTGIYYGDNIHYSNENGYTIDNLTKMDGRPTTDMIGKYSFFHQCLSGECDPNTQKKQRAYYIVGVDRTTSSSSYDYIYFVALEDGNLIPNVNNYTIGGSLTRENTGLYSLNDTYNVSSYDFFNNGLSDIDNAFFCLENNANASSCYIPLKIKKLIKTYYGGYAYTGAEYLNRLDYTISKEFTYQSQSNNYLLTNYQLMPWLGYDENNLSIDFLNYYSCEDIDGLWCYSLNYYYNFNGDATYITVSNGKGVQEALGEMLPKEEDSKVIIDENYNLNEKNSNIKNIIDTWYENNLINYSDFIEDTAYCNSRLVSNYGTWFGGRGNLLFENYTKNTNLKCNIEKDRFGVQNNLAKLSYPVGLITANEANLIGNNVTKSKNKYWTITPRYYVDRAINYYIGSNGSLSYNTVRTSSGIRPVISLKYGTTYLSGDGSMESPFIIN